MSAPAASDRYKRIAADSEVLDRLLIDLFPRSYRKPPREIWLDLDATDDPLHGHQEGRFFHGYYRCYCNLPLYIFCGEHLLCARLRTADKDASSGSVDELQRMVDQIRARWPKTRIVIRGGLRLLPRGDHGLVRGQRCGLCPGAGVTTNAI